MPVQLLHDAVAEAVRRFPERTAVAQSSGDGATLSYQALWEQSERLAAWLQAQGAGAGERVGFWMRKRTEAVVAMLAILRAGAIYVPLDPTAPTARITRLAADCGLRLLLGEEGLLLAARRELAALPSLRCLIAAPRLSPGPAEAPEAAATADPQLPLYGWEEVIGNGLRLAPARRLGEDVAYVLYTSGSTGTPKGVMLSHRHALNFIGWAAQEFALSAEDRVASHAPFHFDLSIFDVFATLSSGARLELLDRLWAPFPAAVLNWIHDRRISVWYSVPSALVQMLPVIAQRPGWRAEHWRVLLFAGEVFPSQALRQWRRLLPQARLANLYGPTETNVCTWYELPASAEAVPEPLPIGQACPGFELRIGDEEGEPLGSGEPGFLWARGEILRGYWGDAERTRAVCRQRRDAGNSPQVWYNTGDLVRGDEHGELQFLGRRDDLVKCRGYRISLLEVQQTLGAAPGVEHAAVLLAGSGSEAYLHAFVAGAVTPAQLRGFCAQRLPVYMVPQRIEVHSSLPLTSTGKVDRRILEREWLHLNAAGEAA